MCDGGVRKERPILCRHSGEALFAGDVGFGESRMVKSSRRKRVFFFLAETLRAQRIPLHIKVHRSLKFYVLGSADLRIGARTLCVLPVSAGKIPRSNIRACDLISPFAGMTIGYVGCI